MLEMDSATEAAWFRQHELRKLPGVKYVGRHSAKLEHVLPPTVVFDMRERAVRILDELRDEYFPGRDIAEVYGQSVPTRLSRIAAYRFLDKLTRDDLMEFLVPAACEFWGPGEYQFYPAFYLRLTPAASAPFYSSQPHYDRTFNASAYSFWIPLVEINEETGGLCLYEDWVGHYIEQELKQGRCNTYDDYLEHHETIDAMTQDSIVTEAMSPGDVFTFDSDVLHGATAGQRLSLDVRLFLASDNEGNKVCDLVDALEANHDAMRRVNLERLGTDDLLARSPFSREYG